MATTATLARGGDVLGPGRARGLEPAADLSRAHRPTLFRGRGEYSVDDKGRCTIPPQMRKPLMDGGVLAVIERKAVVWTELIFRETVDRLQQLVEHDPEKLSSSDLRSLVSNVHTVQLDTQGRIVLPAAARLESGLVGDVHVLGVGPRIEIVAADDVVDEIAGVNDKVIFALDWLHG